MRKILISAALLSASLVAVPAAAQRGYGAGDIARQVDQIENRVNRAAQRGTISRREATGLLRQANQIDQLTYRYARNGLTRQEHMDLQRRVDGLQASLRFERRDDNRRDDRRRR